MKNRKLIGNALLLLTAIIWGSAFAAQRSGMDRIEPVTFVAARMALSALVTGIPFLIMEKTRSAHHPQTRDENRKKIRRNTVIGGIFCGVFLAGGSILQQMGLVYTTAGKAGFITAMYMLLVPIIGFVFLRKKNTWLVWLAVVIGVIGMYFLCVGSEGFYLTKGDTLVCVCAVMFSCQILCIDHFVQFGNPVGIAAVEFAVCSAIAAVIAFVTENPSWDQVVSAAVPILYCGILSGGVGYTLQIVAQKFTDPTIASLLMSLESVFAVLTGTLILHERMTPREAAGCIIMFLAIILVQIPLPKKHPNNS